MTNKRCCGYCRFGKLESDKQNIRCYHAWSTNDIKHFLECCNCFEINSQLKKNE